MARNFRENDSININVNFGPQIVVLVSLGENMCSKETCYLDKLEHRIAQRRCSRLLVGECQETSFPGFVILLIQSTSIVKGYCL